MPRYASIYHITGYASSGIRITYDITPNVTMINEGGSVIFTITTTGIANGTLLYWTTEGTVATNRFSTNTNSGFVIINNNTGTLTRTIIDNASIDSVASFRIVLRTTSITGPTVATSAYITVNDAVTGQVAYTTPGTYTWTVPVGVSTVSVLCIGGGGGGASHNSILKITGGSGAGGGLAYLNNYSVTSGQQFTIIVGAGGAAGNIFSSGDSGYPGGTSSFNSSSIIFGATGGEKGTASLGVGFSARGGSPTGTYTAGFAGGKGGTGYNGTTPPAYGGGGGAAGYAGVGGNGRYIFGSTNYVPTAGAGGGGGGGYTQAGGGGVGILGQGTNGAAGTTGGGGGGSGGSGGGSAYIAPGGNAGNGGAYGGGGAGAYQINMKGGKGGDGAVRIVWPGNARQYPSTNVNSNL